MKYRKNRQLLFTLITGALCISVIEGMAALTKAFLYPIAVQGHVQQTIDFDQDESGSSTAIQGRYLHPYRGYEEFEIKKGLRLFIWALCILLIFDTTVIGDTTLTCL